MASEEKSRPIKPHTPGMAKSYTRCWIHGEDHYAGDSCPKCVEELERARADRQQEGDG